MLQLRVPHFPWYFPKVHIPVGFILNFCLMFPFFSPWICSSFILHNPSYSIFWPGSLFNGTHKTQSLEPNQPESSAVRQELCQQKGLLIVTIRLPFSESSNRWWLELKHGSCPVDSSRAVWTFNTDPTASVLSSWHWIVPPGVFPWFSGLEAWSWNKLLSLVPFKNMALARRLVPVSCLLFPMEGKFVCLLDV